MRLRSILLSALSCSVLATSAQAYDRLQPPEIATGQRAGLAGDLAKLAIGPGDVERGAFSLPSPFTAPGERGELQATIFPSYNPDNGISPWGIGFDTSLEIKRTRIAGSIDYTDADELASPFGRLTRGTDGDWYPVGLQPHVRVHRDGDDLIAYQPDGSVWTFGGAARVVTGNGTYAWHLREIRSATDRRTALTWQANASGELFLASVAYGGVHGNAQYRIDLAYEPIMAVDADGGERPRFVDYRAGVPLAMDQRVKTVTVSAKNAQTGVFDERWHYTLSYTEEAVGAAFYLARIDRTFASGETAPPVTYGYNLRAERLTQTALTEVPQLTQLFQQLGVAGDIVQPQWSAVADANLDGNEDLELGTADRTLVLTRGSGTAADPLRYEVQSLPPPSAPACTSDDQIGCTWSPCRPAANGDDRLAPRQLAQMHPEDTQLSVVAFRYDSDANQSEVSVCSRDGVRTARSLLSSQWSPRDTVRFVDLDHDHLPDFVRASAGRYEIRPNTSSSGGVAWGAPITGDLLGRYGEPVDFTDLWVSDSSGDGIPDLETVVGDTLYVWHGLGGFQFAPMADTFTFTLASGDRLTGLDQLKLIPADLNKDGLQDFFVTNADPSASRVIRYFTNVGARFVETRIPALEELSYSASPPVIGGFDASGNTTVTVTDLGHAYSVALDGPETGLMAFADDGKGTVVRFGYARGPAEPGIRHRCALLSHLEIQTSGTDAIAYDYSYAGVVLHSVGKFPLGFTTVVRHEPLATTTLSFLNEDRASGVLLGSVEADARVPSLVKFAERTYDDASIAGVAWKRLRTERRGWRAGMQEVADTTTYDAYDGVCPTHVTEQTARGTLVTETTRAGVLASHLHCLESRVVRSGTHADPSLDFRVEQTIARNAAGQLTELATLGPDGSEVEQRVTYDADGQIATVEAPGHGTLTTAYDAATTLLREVATGTGLTTRVEARDPSTDTVTGRATLHGSLALREQLRFDGQERLVARWNDADGSSETSPAETYAYAYATTNTPASVTLRTRVDDGSTRENVELYDGADEKLATAVRAPAGWVFDGFTAISRSARERDRFVIGNQSASPATLDYATLLGGSPARVQTESASAFGFAAAASTTFHARVTREATTTLALDATGLVRTELVNGLYGTAKRFDVGDKLETAFTDEAGNTWTYRYDALGRLRDVILPDGAHHRVAYDAYCRVHEIRRDGVATATYAYRALDGGTTDQVASVTWSSAPTDGTAPVAQRTETFTYDSAGRVLQHAFADDALATRTFTFAYDGDLPTTITGDGFTKTLAYRGDGKLARRTIAIDGFRTIDTRFAYLGDGSVRTRTVTVTDPAGAVVASTAIDNNVDALGRPATTSLDGVPLETVQYDAFDRASAIAFANGDSVSLTYDDLTRALVGRVQSRADGAWGGDAVVRMTHSPRGFVGEETQAVGGDHLVRSYQYSPQGYLTAVVDTH
jgi:YD repeat-containing protein